MTNFYSTKFGKMHLISIEDFIDSADFNNLKGKVQLIFTSPPFPLNKKKEYGNFQGQEYKDWLSSIMFKLCELLSPTGSIVIEMGNGWEPQKPTFSTLPIETLLQIKNDSKLHLCQEFICYNPARLPSPAQWVTIEKIRTVDSYSRLWWMSKVEKPKADNTKILRPYSSRMKKLLLKQEYNYGKRPSHHNISKTSFLKDNKGSIMPNLIQIENLNCIDSRMPENIFSISNTTSNSNFLKLCKQNNIVPHPARMPLELVEIFIEFLTDPGDIIFDPFGGSNTTGFVSEKLERNWIVTELREDYVNQSKLRFEGIYGYK